MMGFMVKCTSNCTIQDKENQNIYRFEQFRSAANALVDALFVKIHQFTRKRLKNN
jgi:hypothetical protein